jgi:hypothetical protein
MAYSDALMFKLAAVLEGSGLRSKGWALHEARQLLDQQETDAPLYAVAFDADGGKYPPLKLIPCTAPRELLTLYIEEAGRQWFILAIVGEEMIGMLCLTIDIQWIQDSDPAPSRKIISQVWPCSSLPIGIRPEP